MTRIFFSALFFFSCFNPLAVVGAAAGDEFANKLQLDRAFRKTMLGIKSRFNANYLQIKLDKYPELLNYQLPLSDDEFNYFGDDSDDEIGEVERPKSYTAQTTLLMEAGWQGLVDCVEILLERGADHQLRDINGQSAYDLLLNYKTRYFDKTMTAKINLNAVGLEQEGQAHHCKKSKCAHCSRIAWSHHLKNKAAEFKNMGVRSTRKIELVLERLKLVDDDKRQKSESAFAELMGDDLEISTSRKTKKTRKAKTLASCSTPSQASNPAIISEQSPIPVLVLASITPAPAVVAERKAQQKNPRTPQTKAQHNSGAGSGMKWQVKQRVTSCVAGESKSENALTASSPVLATAHKFRSSIASNSGGVMRRVPQARPAQQAPKPLAATNASLVYTPSNLTPPLLRSPLRLDTSLDSVIPLIEAPEIIVASREPEPEDPWALQDLSFPGQLPHELTMELLDELLADTQRDLKEFHERQQQMQEQAAKNAEVLSRMQQEL